MKPIALALLLLAAAAAVAEEAPNFISAHTAASANARFELVQSPLLASQFFRLDRFTGDVWQYVRDKDGTVGWEPMYAAGFPRVLDPKQPRFQIFLSGAVVRHALLFDTLIGSTWVLTQMSPELLTWEPVKNFNIAEGK